MLGDSLVHRHGIGPFDHRARAVTLAEPPKDGRANAPLSLDGAAPRVVWPVLQSSLLHEQI